MYFFSEFLISSTSNGLSYRMESTYASEFVKLRILPENRSQALITLNEVGAANFVGLGPQLRKENVKSAKKSNKKAKLLPKYKRLSTRDIKRLIRRQQNLDLTEMTCPPDLPRRLNDLWNMYSKSIVDWKGVNDDTNISSHLENILRMDLIGARMRVLRSITTKQVDLEGIVIMETRNVFYFATEGDENSSQVKLVPKKGTMFKLIMPGAEVVLNGNCLAYRPIDRTLRKWKSNQNGNGKKRRGAIYTDLFNDYVFAATNPTRSYK
ncbi:unnamed protein product [Hymenolepis diminuta]|uniref:Ribonuclease P protein subunit p29 n=1 Tax=Hymenolepis diminuta TaxID=6216 RepID=A0A564XY50_HYMDI|nr:unnamed protein product [Hymenolepis diminuta]